MPDPPKLDVPKLDPVCVVPPIVPLEVDPVPVLEPLDVVGLPLEVVVPDEVLDEAAAPDDPVPLLVVALPLDDFPLDDDELPLDDLPPLDQ